MVKKESKDQEKTRLWYLGLFIVLMFVLWLLTFFGVSLFSETLSQKEFDKLEYFGQLGDMFGTVNALFSAMAFAGVLFAIYLQKKELGLQRKELEDSRVEFQINRISNVLYRQIELINSAEDSFLFLKTHSGRAGILLVSERLQAIIESNEKLGVAIGPQDKNVAELYKGIIKDSYNSLSQLLERLVGSQRILIELLGTSKDLAHADKEMLREILRINVSKDLLQTLIYLREVSKIMMTPRMNKWFKGPNKQKVNSIDELTKRWDDNFGFMVEES